MLVIRGSLAGIAQLAFFAVLLIVPAGLVADEWGWPRGWLFVGGYGVIMLSSVVSLALYAPASLEARLRLPASEGQPVEDRITTFVLVALMVLYLVFIPLDVFLWQLFGQPSLAVSALGAVLIVLGYCLMLWTIWINRFAIPIVEDQSEQGQRLIDTGPYAIVRHPMYLGLLPFLLGIGLWLGSWASVPLIAIIILPLVVRIRIEERMLLATLDGYADYCSRCRYRLVPGVW